MHGTPGWARDAPAGASQTVRRVLLPSGGIGDSMPVSHERSRSCGRSQYQQKAIRGSSEETAMYTAMYIVEFRHEGDGLAEPMAKIRTWLHHAQRFPILARTWRHVLPRGIQSRERG